MSARGAIAPALALAATAIALWLSALPAPAANGPSRLLVTGREYNLTLSRPAIARGGAVIQLLNRGEDDHDLRLQRISRSGARRPVARWSVTRPGRVSELSVRLRPGHYRLWCSLSGHRARGMRATLKVSGG